MSAKTMASYHVAIVLSWPTAYTVGQVHTSVSEII